MSCYTVSVACMCTHINISKRSCWVYFTEVIIHSLVQFNCTALTGSNGDSGGWTEPK